MNIKSVIISCDANPYYLDFWGVASQQWKTQLNITPILCYVGVDDSHISRKYGEVIRYDPIAGISSAFQGQWLRFFHATTYGNDTVIVADIDLLPFPHPLYREWIQDFDDRCYLHTSWTRVKRGRFAACFHIAKSALLKDVWEMPDRYEASVHAVINSPHTAYDGANYNWGFDELYTTQKMTEYFDQSIFFHFLQYYKDDRLSSDNLTTVSRRLWYYDTKALKQNQYPLAEPMRPHKRYLPLNQALIRHITIPNFFCRMFRLAKTLRVWGKHSNRVFRIRTRLPYRVVYYLYINGLNFYFRLKQNAATNDA